MFVPRSPIGRLLRALPGDRKRLKASVRSVLARKERMLTRLRYARSGVLLPDPLAIYWIDPQRVEFATCLDNGSADWEDWVLPQMGRVELVRGGDWDRLLHRFAAMRVSRAIHERIHSSVAWASTDYYRTAVATIESGRPLWNCRTRAEFDARCVQLDRLIERIARDGYRAAAEQSPAKIDTAIGQTEVLVNVSRDGLPLFQDGRHRLAIARSLGVPKIAVQVHVRHSQWQEFREFLLRGASSAEIGEFSITRPSEHFDLDWLPVTREEENCWHAIATRLPATSSGRALDIGCRLGFICHRLEERGFTVLGIESQPRIAAAALRLTRTEGKSVVVIEGDVLKEATLSRIGTEFDIVVARRVFHHFLKTESGCEALRALLGRLKTERLFFEPHRPDEDQMRGAYLNPEPEDFARLIARWAGLQRVELIHTTDDGGVLFELSGKKSAALRRCGVRVA